MLVATTVCDNRRPNFGPVTHRWSWRYDRQPASTSRRHPFLCQLWDEQESRMKQFTSLFLICVAIALMSVITRAQTVTGNLDGRITDPSGGAIPGLQVVARNMDTGVERVTVTNEDGYFAMPFLPIGIYDMTVAGKGFATLVTQGNVVTLNKTTTLNLSLQLSSIQQSVTVSEAPQLIDLASGQI